MDKKALSLGILMIFGVLLSTISYASSSFFSSGFDVSIDSVIVNNQAVSQSKNNLLDDSDIFFVTVGITAVKDIQSGHIEATMRGRQSGNVVADTTGTFDLFEGQSTTAFLALRLTDGLPRENDYELDIKIVNAKGSSEQKIYGIKTKRSASLKGALDVSIDRVKVNSKAVASSTNNFIDESNNFEVLAEFTALENAENAHVEAVMKDLSSGNSVADSSSNFNLAKGASSSKLLKLELLDKLKRSGSFELTVKIIDAEGNIVKQTYGIRMKGENAASSAGLDVSVDSVDVEGKVLADNENNFVLIGDKKDIDVRIKFTALESIKDARVDAILSFGNGDVVADTTSTFNMSRDEKAVKTLRLNLVNKFKQNSFKLRLTIRDSEGNSAEKSYGLKISEEKLPFFVSNIILNPEEKVQPGRALGVTVVIKHSGVVQLDGITAKVSIPDLGLSSTKLLSGKTSSNDQITEEFILRIPENTEPGDYTLKAEIANQFDSSRDSREISFSVKGRPEMLVEQDADFSISVPIGKQDMKNDGTEVIYPITITNEGENSKSVAVVLDGANWADLKFREPNAFVLKAKESKTMNIYASTKAKVSGEKTFFVTVKQDDKMVRQIQLRANVINVKEFFSFALVSNLKGLLQLALVIVLIALITIGVFYGLREISRKGEKSREETPSEIPDMANGEAYY